MKKVFLSLCLLIAVALAASGCAFMGPEDRDFYGKGWVKPTDLDREPLTHKIPDPSHPETTAASTATTPAAEPAPVWITPIQSSH